MCVFFCLFILSLLGGKKWRRTRRKWDQKSFIFVASNESLKILRWRKRKQSKHEVDKDGDGEREEGKYN